MKRDLFYMVALLLNGACHNVPEPNYQAWQQHQAKQEHQSREMNQPSQDTQAKRTSREHNRVSNKPMNDAVDDYSYTIVNETPYYKDGPQQARPADGVFAKGTKVKHIQEAGSYSLVESADGIKAFVAFHDMKKIGP